MYTHISDFSRAPHVEVSRRLCRCISTFLNVEPMRRVRCNWAGRCVVPFNFCDVKPMRLQMCKWAGGFVVAFQRFPRLSQCGVKFVSDSTVHVPITIRTPDQKVQVRKQITITCSPVYRLRSAREWIKHFRDCARIDAACESSPLCKR